MRYITLVTPSNRRLMVIDRVRPILTELIDAAYYADKFQCSAVLSNYKNIFDASRANLVGAKRLEGGALLAFLEDLQCKARYAKRKCTLPALALRLAPFSSARSACSPENHDSSEEASLRGRGVRGEQLETLGADVSSISLHHQRGTKASNSPEYSG